MQAGSGFSPLCDGLEFRFTFGYDSSCRHLEAGMSPEEAMALTKRQKEIYDYVRDFIHDRGYSPSLQEIGQHVIAVESH